MENNLLDKQSLVKKFAEKVFGENQVNYEEEHVELKDSNLKFHFHEYAVYVTNDNVETWIDEALSASWREYVVEYLQNQDAEIEQDMGIASNMAKTYCDAYNATINKNILTKLVEIKKIQAEVAELESQLLKNY